MALIKEAILNQTFETIRDRIYNILKLEFPQQQIYQPGIDLSPEIVKERSIAFDKDQGSVINVMFVNDVNASKTPVSKVGDFLYYIDVWTNKKDTDNASGDELSRVACQRIVGVVRGILESDAYKFLGYDNLNPRPIQKLNVSMLELATPDSRKDASNVEQARIQFEVRSTDINALGSVRELDIFEAQFTLDETDKGFLFTKDV